MKMNEIDSKTMAAIKSIPSTTRLWLGGYRVDIAQDDEKFYTEIKMAEEIVTNSRSKEENDPEEVDKAKKVGENENNTLSKDEIFKQALLVLLNSVEVKTTKIDKLIEELEEM